MSAALTVAAVVVVAASTLEACERDLSLALERGPSAAAAVALTVCAARLTCALFLVASAAVWVAAGGAS